MKLKEKSTDLWVYDLLKEANINLDAQGSTIKEINDALKMLLKEVRVKLVFLNILAQ